MVWWYAGIKRLAMTNCQNCDRLARENAALRLRIEKLESKVFWLQQTIEAARAVALTIYNQSAAVMAQHQARGTWSYHKGRGEAAAELYNILSATTEG